MKISKYIAIIVLGVLGLTSCRKETDEIEPPIELVDGLLVETNDVSLHFMNKWGMDDDFAYNTVYDVNGVNVKFVDLRYYLSNFEVHDDADNSAMIAENKVILIDAGSTEHVDLGSIPESFSHIHEMHFLFGLDTITNHQDPIVAEAPLNDASMHWGWNPDGGYKFMVVEGEVEIDGDYQSFAIHLATDPVLRSLSKEVHRDVENNSIMLMTMVNYQQLFTGVDFANLEGTHGSHPLTNMIADEVANAIDIME